VGGNAKPPTPTKATKPRGRRKGLNYINLALIEATARLKDNRPIDIPSIAQAVGCTPENLNQSKRFVRSYDILTAAMRRAVRGRKADGVVEAEDAGDANF
jgi:hypothetical protein